MRRRRVHPLPFLVPAPLSRFGSTLLVPVPVPVIAVPGGRWGGRSAAVRAVPARGARSR